MNCHHRRIAAAFVCVVASLVVGCHDAATAPNTGTLAVSVSGLPAGVKPAVVVSGPSSFTQTLDSSRTLTALPQGSFTVTANDVTSGIVRYSGTPATQTVVVKSDGTSSATPIIYGIGSGRLTLTVFGLPASTSANVVLTGPKNFSRTLTGSTQLDLLEPGTYALTANDVSAIGKTFRAVTTAQQVSISASLASPAITIDYGAGLATLRVAINGLPSGVDGAVDVTGPNGYSRRLTASATLGRLEDGSYSVAAAVVSSVLTTHSPSPERQTISLSGAQDVAATTVYNSAPLQLGVQLFADGLTQAVFLTAPAGDARQFIVERGGRVKLVVNGVIQATYFADIASRVNNVGERGLLGMAFDPAYTTNGLFYLYYVGLNGDLVLERMTSTSGANVATGSGGIVLRIPHGRSEHHGGMIEFGPDGMLYLGPGDGGCCGDPYDNAQNLTTLLGKILRIDVSTLPYRVPSNNPFAAGAAFSGEIWAWGLRNPWRFAIDGPSGMLYIGDVGQDAREEVDAVPVRTAGLNFGWPYMEGTACYKPSTNCAADRVLTLPVIDYPHADGCSVIGGYVYRGRAMPELTGHYLYADYCRGWLRSLRLVGGVAADTRTWSGISLAFTNSFGRDGSGELYMVAAGKIWKIVRQPN